MTERWLLRYLFHKIILEKNAVSVKFTMQNAIKLIIEMFFHDEAGSKGTITLTFEMLILHVAVHCSVLQCVAVCCRTIALPFEIFISHVQRVAVCCSALQCVAARCSVLPCVAVCCRVLQSVAVNADFWGVYFRGHSVSAASCRRCVCVCICV